MPKFISIHIAPGVSEDEFRMNTPTVLEAKHAKPIEIFANLMEGFIVTYYDAADDASLVREFERLGFPYQEIHEIQFSATAEDLKRMIGT